MTYHKKITAPFMIIPIWPTSALPDFDSHAPFLSRTQDGLIGRDELLLMLNQVPRTLLNIGIDPADKDPALSQTFDWNSLKLEAESKTREDGPGGSPPAMVTPRGRRPGGATPDLFGRDDGPPPLPSARARGAAIEKGSKGEVGSTPPGEGQLRSMFTNERIADQALEDFGDGAVSRGFGLMLWLVVVVFFGVAV